MLTSDEDFIKAWKATGGRAAEVAKLLGYTGVPNVYARRRAIEKKGLGERLTSAGDAGHKGRGDAGETAYNYNPRLMLDGFTGTAVFFSDCHWWPGISETPAYKALLEVIRQEKPKLIVGNGDLLDAARISRFGRIGWDQTPKLPDELEEVKARCAEIRHAYRGAQLVRTIGNHDIRFDSWLASKAADFEGIGGFRLSDHLPEWRETMALWINGHTVVKHRWHNGINAGRNNTLKAGKTMVTGHDHILQATPYSDYNGLRWAVQDGTLAEPQGPQFAYGEDNPSQANSGFAVLTFDKDGSLFDPELCRVRDGVAYFRGQRVAGRRKVAA
jgi:hypothetical protein